MMRDLSRLMRWYVGKTPILKLYNFVIFVLCMLVPAQDQIAHIASTECIQCPMPFSHLIDQMHG